MIIRHSETHRVGVGGWLRAAVLGANDGVVSIASLVVGVAAADASARAILTAGVAGLVGGALSMAVGEYVSVSSQRDVEEADLRRERGMRPQGEARLRCESSLLIYWQFAPLNLRARSPSAMMPAWQTTRTIHTNRYATTFAC
jgi:hypothetical protein